MFGVGSKVTIKHKGNYYDGFDGEVEGVWADAVRVKVEVGDHWDDWDEVMFMREQVELLK